MSGRFMCGLKVVSVGSVAHVNLEGRTIFKWFDCRPSANETYLIIYLKIACRSESGGKCGGRFKDAVYNF